MSDIRNISQLLNALSRGYSVRNGAVVAPANAKAARQQEKAERHFCISIAGHTVGIDSMYGDTYLLCRNYLSEDDPDIQVKTTEEDIRFEHEEAIKENMAIQKEGYLETLAVYRKICEEMISFDTFLMHGAVIAYRNDSYMFSAKSGTGKTTHIRKWLARLDDAYVVNGDKPLIRMTGSEAIACGTPWCGKEIMETNTMIPLKAIVLMERGEENRMEEISFRLAFPMLLQQTYRPNGSEKMKKTIQLVSQLNGKVRFFRFIFNNMKDDAFDVAYQALTGEKA